MQTVSADLEAAILAKQRQPVCRLRVDWDDDGSFTTVGSGYKDDISADVVSVDLSRELATDLPAQAKLYAGAAAAQATVTLVHRDPAGDPVKHGGWFYSGLNSGSPLFAKQRKGAAATLDFGFVTAAGSAEYVSVLVGTVRSLTVSAGGRQAVMVVADLSETMRQQVQLPMVVADGEDTALAGATLKRPGLSTTWLADYVARRCGYNASPPQRTGCKFLATYHGSSFPEVGTMEEVHGENGSQLSFDPTPTFSSTPRWVQSTAPFDGGTSQFLRYFLGGSGVISPNNGRTVFVQGWWKFSSTAADVPFWIIFDSAAAGATAPFVSLFWQGVAGANQFKLQVLFNRGGADNTQRAIVGPTVTPGTTDWHYYAVLVSFTSTGVTATFRYDDTTTGPTTTATPSVTGGPEFLRIQVNRGRIGAYADSRNTCSVEDVQVTTESSISTWDDEFIPTAEIHATDAFESRVLATPDVRERGWELLQRIAAAEFATTGFDENGMLYYWPRDRWTTSPYTTSQRTLTAAAALKEIATVEAVDQIVNRVTIQVTTPIITDLTTVWKLGGTWSVPASGSLTKHIKLNDPVANVDTTVVYTTALGSTRYLASDVRDGQGSQVSNLTFTITVLSPTIVRVTIDNPNAFRVYLHGDENASSTYAGRPYFWLAAQWVLFTGEPDNNSREFVTATDAASIAAFGNEQLLEIGDNDFRQEADDVQQLADDLIDDLADPGPAITDIPAVGDPRIQLGDRVRIVDPDGLVMDEEFHCSAVNFNYDSGGLEMTLSLRKA